MKILLIPVALLALITSLESHALGPFQVYESALLHDPVFQGAMKAREAGRESDALGLAGLLPRLSYSHNLGRNESRVTSFRAAGSSHDQRRYRSTASALTLQQPLIDYEAYAAYRKGVAQSLFADEVFRTKSQELLLRVLSAYTRALLAQDQIEIAQARKKAFEQQLQRNTRLFRQGEGTRTDMLEAESRLELATAQQIEAHDEQDAALQELGALMGEPRIAINDLAPLSATFQAFPMEPATFDHWHRMALVQNPLLASQRQAVEVARYEVERSRAGHLPKVTAYASLRKSESDSSSTYDQRNSTNSIGVELSVPLFAGGGVSASVRKASRSLEQTEYELEAKTRETLIELRRQFSACLSGESKLRAYQKALASAESLVDSTQKSLLGGERVNLDLLNAEQQRFSTRSELAKARYDYLMAWVKLRFHAGILNEGDLARIDEVFVGDIG